MITDLWKKKIVEASQENRLEFEHMTPAEWIELARVFGVEGWSTLPVGADTPAKVVLAFLAGDALGLTIPQTLILAKYDDEGRLFFDDLELEEDAGDDDAQADEPPAGEVDPDTIPIELNEAAIEALDQFELDRPVHWRRFESVGKARGFVLHKRVGVKTPRQLLTLVQGMAWRADVGVFEVLKGKTRYSIVAELVAWCEELDEGEVATRQVAVAAGAAKRLEKAEHDGPDAEEHSASLQVFDWAAQNLVSNGWFETAAHARAAVKYETALVDREAEGLDEVGVLCHAVARLVVRCRRHRTWVGEVVA